MDCVLWIKSLVMSAARACMCLCRLNWKWAHPATSWKTQVTSTYMKKTYIYLEKSRQNRYISYELQWKSIAQRSGSGLGTGADFSLSTQSWMSFYKRAIHRERRKDKGSKEGSCWGMLGMHLDPPAPPDRPLQPGPFTLTVADLSSL